MPNEANIESPLIIIGAGRAGTSWLQVALRNHPAVQRVIDNTIVGSVYKDVFNSWWSMAFITRVCNNDESMRDELVVQTIRAALTTMFRGQQPYWATKAIWDWTKESFGGVPNEFRLKLFPKARYLHFARDPRTAMPSILEYFKGRGLLDTIARCEEAYVDAHRDAFRMRDAGVPSLVVKQEDIRKDPVGTWRKIEAFAGFEPYELPEELLRSEINQSKSMIGKVHQGREPLKWSELRADTHAVARMLGYDVPAGVAPRSEEDAREELAHPESQNTIERLATEKYHYESEVRRLEAKVAEMDAYIQRQDAYIKQQHAQAARSWLEILRERLFKK